ncbi:arsenate reductase/protein-tyrosine-phosphatase family protein [Candidatus Nitrospira bockiana]
MKAVLILGEEPRIVVAVARSLARCGVAVDVAAMSPHAPSISSRAIRRFVRLPSPEADPLFFFASLLQRVVGFEYDRVIPASDTALSVIAEHFETVAEIAPPACPAPGIVRRVLDKSCTLALAARHGVPVPETYPVTCAADVDARLIRFPVIAKPARKRAGAAAAFKVRRFETAAELRAAFETYPRFDRDYVVQEFCPGVGVGVEVLMHKGRPLALFQHRRVKEFPSAGGVSVVAVSQAVDPLLAQHAVRLLRALDWDGVAMVEFRVDPESGRAVLMEVNGRYWGSLALSIHAGMDFPRYDWELAQGGTPVIPQTYRVGVRARWTAGSLQRLRDALRGEPAGGPSALRTVADTVADALPPTKDMLWSWRDPHPGFSELERLLRSLLRGALAHLVRRAIPAPMLVIRRRSLALDTRARRVFLAKALGRGVGLQRDRVPAWVAHARSVLFVCHGNIVRSPMAAALLRQALEKRGRSIEVESAGLHANPLNGADPRAVAAVAEYGVSLRDHRATPVTPDLVRRADVVFVMDHYNEAELLARFRSAKGKVVLLGACRSELGCDLEIDDPYRGTFEDVRRCCDTLRARIEDLADRLVQGMDGEGLAPPLYAEQRAASGR